MNCSSEVMPWWYSRGCDPVLVLGQGVPHFPHLLRPEEQQLGVAGTGKSFAFMSGGGEI